MPRDLVQGEVGRDQRRAATPRQGDELEIDGTLFRHIVVDDVQGLRLRFAQTLQDVEPPPASSAPHRLFGIGDVLQFPKNELRDDEVEVEEPALGDVGEAAVDQRGRVDQRFARSSFRFARRPHRARPEGHKDFTRENHRDERGDR